jgi:hypothetical protein
MMSQVVNYLLCLIKINKIALYIYIGFSSGNNFDSF